MTNAVGYFRDEREEALSPEAKTKSGRQSFDINRDFPYNQSKPQGCLNTVAARIIYQIFAKNDISGCLTFHGGTNVIGYPWGSFNRAYKDKDTDDYVSFASPDHNLFHSFGVKMQEMAGGVISFSDLPGYLIKPYVLGDMTSTVYAVRGGLEDWGYAAGWDTEDGTGTMSECKPVTYPLEKGIDLTFEA